MAGETFRKPLQPGQTRLVTGSTGRDRLPLNTAIKENRNMARLEGTGKDPLGRYGKGEVFDVPRFITTPDAASDGQDPAENPAYSELIDKGWAKPVKPEDDPARTVTQIADAMVVDPNATLAHPEDAAIAEKIGSQVDAYAIVQTGDPNATAADIGGGSLKPDSVTASQRDDRQQYSAAVALGEEPIAAQSDGGGAQGGDGGSSSGSGSSSSRRGGGSSS